MHEVIDYSKNFLTGITKTVKKNKEDTMYKGTATIQLYDEKNKLIQEVKSTNCISSTALSRMYGEFFRTNLLLNKRDGLSDRAAFLSPAYFMLLTNGTNPEDPTQKYMFGDVIGYANGWQSYSGADTKRGSLNISETITGDWNKHIVIDFPTHACNGTFQSVYWVPGIDNDVPISLSMKADTTHKRLGNNTNCDLAVVGDYVYTAVYINGNYKKIEQINLKTNETLKQIDFETDVLSLSNFGNDLYVLGPEKIYKLGMDMNIVSSFLHNVPGLEAYYRTNIHLVITESNAHIIDKNGALHTLDKSSGIFKSKKDTALAGVKSAYYEGKNIIKILNEGIKFSLYEFNESTLKLNQEFKRAIIYADNRVSTSYSDSESYYYLYSIAKKDNRLYFLAGVSGSDIYLQSGSDCTYFSHTLLPEPITKTSANTMKIQYDFVVEPRGYFDV